MKFQLEGALEILRQTPYSLTRMLEDLSPDWTRSSGDRKSWAAYDVVGHLIHGEKTDWIPRAEIILAQGDSRTFVPFNRTAQFDNAVDRSLRDLLTEFAHLRSLNLETLMSWQLSADDLLLKGMHPELGEVTLEQLLATWVVHDLNHIRQISTALAAKYADNVGPWKAYLSILQ